LIPIDRMQSFDDRRGDPTSHSLTSRSQERT
jgi:hypothetical protein